MQMLMRAERGLNMGFSLPISPTLHLFKLPLINNYSNKSDDGLIHDVKYTLHLQ